MIKHFVIPMFRYLLFELNVFFFGEHKMVNWKRNSKHNEVQAFVTNVVAQSGCNVKKALIRERESVSVSTQTCLEM